MARGWLRGVFDRSSRQDPAAPADLSALFELAVAHHREGRLAEARAAYDQVLIYAPANLDALHLSGLVHYQLGEHAEALRRIENAVRGGLDQAAPHSNLGLVLQQLGRPQDALEAYERALFIQPDFDDAIFNRGNALRDLGRFAEALDCYQRVVEARPDFAQALNNRGLLLGQLGRDSEALESFDRVLSLRPGHAEAYNNRGATLCALGRYDEALADYGRAVVLNPDHPGAYNNRGATLAALGRHAEALASYDRALELDPGHAEAHYNKACALSVLKRHEDALAEYDDAVRFRPTYAEAWNGRGTTLRDLGRRAEALDSCERALAARPDFPEALDNLGIALAGMGRHEEALASHEAALRLRPGFASALSNRAAVLREIGDRAAAIEAYDRAVAANPASLAIRFKRLVAFVPVLAADEGETLRSRLDFGRETGALAAWCTAHGDGEEQQGVGAAQPFHLAYQEENNRELLAGYGTLCADLMRRWQFRSGPPAAAKIGPARSRLRIGIVSAHIHDHSVWNAIVRGWMAQIDPGRFEIDVYHLGTARDAQTEFAIARSSCYLHGDRSLADWAAAIGARGPDVLIYPEIGMDIMTPRLASLRLAPVQIAAWGHPETTGLPTIDYYLSAGDFETAESQTHYTERLVRLPNLGCYYDPERVAVPSISRSALGLTRDSPLLVCPGTPFKYTPRHDPVFVKIALRLPEAQFVFFTFENAPLLSARLLTRIANAFRRAGLDPSRHLSFIPWQSRPAFHALMGQSDVFLDTIGFSGFNTAMQAVECGLPIVTYEGRFMRGRFASAILRRLRLEELVCRSDEEYVECTVRLVLDRAFATSTRERMRTGERSLYRDAAPIRALEDLLSNLKPAAES